MIARDEWLAFSKTRALQYLDAGELANAFSSMGSDLRKHPELGCSENLLQLGMTHMINRDAPAMRRWIEGFR